MKCENCKKRIVDKDTACFARESNVFLCSLDCLTDYAHEYLGCIPIEELETKDNSQSSSKEKGNRGKKE